MSLILVVDDEVDLRLLLCTLLEEAGYETISAADGADAIAMSLQHRPDEHGRQRLHQQAVRT